MRSALLALGFILLLALPPMLVGGCAQSVQGPAFRAADAPPANRTRLYVYRVDSQHSLSTIKTTLDGLEIGTFRDQEYETMEIASGSHRIRASMRGFAFLNWGWSEHTFHARPGETVYIRLDVHLESSSDSPVSQPRDLQIAGRPTGRASENVFIGGRNRSVALAELATTTRLPAEQ
jgi:hypothetical protein